jgi:hypothetical protein
VIPPKSYTAEDSQLLKDCARVQAGTAFTGSSFARTVQAAVDSIKQKAFAAAGIGPAQQRAMEDLDRHGAVAWRDTLLVTQPSYGPYAARRLHGIWAAAPYLHNGSVPIPASTTFQLCLDPVRQIRLKSAAKAELKGTLGEPVSRHGLCAGFVTTAYRNGVPDEEWVAHITHRATP